MSAVPSATYKVPTAALKDGCVCVNVAADKNFEPDVRDKVQLRVFDRLSVVVFVVYCVVRVLQASLYIPAVGKVTILMLLRNL